MSVEASRSWYLLTIKFRINDQTFVGKIVHQGQHLGTEQMSFRTFWAKAQQACLNDRGGSNRRYLMYDGSMVSVCPFLFSYYLLSNMHCIHFRNRIYKVGHGDWMDVLEENI